MLKVVVMTDEKNDAAQLLLSMDKICLWGLWFVLDFSVVMFYVLFLVMFKSLFLVITFGDVIGYCFC